jgi:hypothetical protein
MEQPMALNGMQNSERPATRRFPTENHATSPALEHTRNYNSYILVKVLGRLFHDNNRSTGQVPNALVELRLRVCYANLEVIARTYRDNLA